MKIDFTPRSVKGTDLKISRLVMGAMTFGSQVAEPEADRMVGLARDSGVTMFDTANAYNSGTSEEILGRIVRPFRSDIQIATKIGMSKAPEPPLSVPAVLREVDLSLQRLSTDYVDVLYLHAPDPRTPVEETLSALDKVVRAGKARYIAQSNYAAWQITELHYLAAPHNWPTPQISQQMYNLLARRIEEEYEACARRLQLLTIAYNPLAGGLLSGKHKPQIEPVPGTRFSLPHYRARYWNEAQFEAVQKLESIAHDANLSLLELAYRWLLSRPVVDAVVVGASKLKQLKANLAAAQGEQIGEEMLTTIEEIWHPLRGPAPAYNR